MNPRLAEALFKAEQERCERRVKEEEAERAAQHRSIAEGLVAQQHALAFLADDPSILAQIRSDMEGAEMLTRVAREQVQRDTECDIDEGELGHQSRECYNCHIKVHHDGDLVAEIGPYCSANCALRKAMERYETGDIRTAQFEYTVEKLHAFSGDTVEARNLKPFPPFTGKWCYDVINYHFTAELPPGFSINYFDRRKGEEFQQRKLQIMQGDEAFTEDEYIAQQLLPLWALDTMLTD